MKNSNEIWLALSDIEHENLHLKDKLRLSFQIFNILIEQATAEENISFTSLFARLSFASAKFHLDGTTLFLSHQYRRFNERENIQAQDLDKLIELGLYINKKLLFTFWGEGNNSPQLSNETFQFFKKKDDNVVSFKKLIEALIISIDQENKHIHYLDDEDSDQIKIAHYDVADSNEIFTENINTIQKIYKLPIHANLLDVKFLETGDCIPSSIVINPNYLIDVTSIANSYKESGGNNWLHVMYKLMVKESSSSILIGNTANFLLDQLIYNPEMDFQSLLAQVFLRDPITWALYDDAQVKELVNKIEVHYLNLKRVIKEDFDKKGINKKKIYLEPSFYCRDYGIQGRLDLLHIDKTMEHANIIELKSGKPFKANSYGINQNHYIQTLLYELIIQSAYYNKLKPINFILYSVLESDNLKYAPSVKQQQYETMKTRNELTSIEHALAKDHHMVRKLLIHMSRSSYPDMKGFLANDINAFEGIYTSLTELEKLYYEHFVSFISREQILAKTGEHGVNKSNGLSALWMETTEEKQDRFSIFNYLQIIKNETDQEVPIIIFNKTEYTSQLANFRIGDIAVLYPHSFNSRNILHHQIFKCNILAIDEKQIVVRLRSPQQNQDIFRTTEFWNIEEDVLDSAFRHMYQSLFTLIASNDEKRKLILGINPPAYHYQALDLPLDDQLTPEQKSILMKVFNSKDYFLLWGPPGTGKTSMMIKNLSYLLFRHTEHNIMLLAYTNRAVDEICQALHDAGLQDEYIRIGSRTSIGEEYLPNMMEEKIKGSTTRIEILNLIKGKRIYVSTISSLLGKQDIFQLVEFDMAIVDEASQVLEPMLVGLLTKFNRFVLIGDHKQLPAVVRQKNDDSMIQSEALITAGFLDMRVSLFERLLNQCKSKNWNHAWDILSYQGRMHRDIMQFADHHFYEGKLKTIPNLQRLINARHLKALYDSDRNWIDRRIIFIDSPTDVHYNWKTNRPEAEIVKNVIKKIKQIYIQSNKMISADTIGVITPYRAQIALLKSIIPDENLITIDTVERYQGGARDIIIISLCTNRLSQLESLVNLSNEGIDRKLNVAITRAKEQIILIGNKDILTENATYRSLIEASTELQI